MALLQIAEPDQSAAPHQHKLAVGIDLGTTNSLVASVQSGVAGTLLDENGQDMLPSIVHYAEQGHVLIGLDAKPFLNTDPLNTLVSVKRLMGKALVDLKADTMAYDLSAHDSGLVQIETRIGAVNAVQASSEILKKLKNARY